MFPRITEQLCDGLGYGCRPSLLDSIATVLGASLPVLAWRYGALLRAKSSYATNIY